MEREDMEGMEDRDIDKILDELHEKVKLHIEDADKEADELLSKIMTAIDAIKEKHGKEIPQEFISDSIEVCPVCHEGKLSYTISDYNGHIHGQCSKKGCVCWMQ